MKKSVLLIAVLFSATPSLMAHDAHNHEAAVESAPHGGTLRNAGDFKSEIVINGDVVKLYIYDKQLKPVKADAAELEHPEGLPVQAAALLAEQDRSRTRHFDREGRVDADHVAVQVGR